MAERLYLGDSWLLEFQARVAALGELGGQQAVVLDRTAFYPEGGGQLGDRGRLGGLEVTDTQVDDGGVIHHLFEGEPPKPGAEVAGVVSKAWRRANMAAHTGQHMLSRALLDEAGAATVSSRLGERVCTIDVDRESISEGDLGRALDLCNAVVDDDVEVRAWVPAESELAALPLRRDPKVENEIRVVQIGDYDVSPCGGTHCTRSGQVGLVHLQQIERKKGGLRLYFVAGPRGRRELSLHSEILRGIGRRLSAPPEEVGERVVQLSEELGAKSAALSDARRAQAEALAAELLAGARMDGQTNVVAAFPGADADLLRRIGRTLTAQPDIACFLAAPGETGAHVLVARGEECDVDCGATLRALAKSCGGRGGGRVEHAEGRFPADVDWPTLVAAHLTNTEEA